LLHPLAAHFPNVQVMLNELVRPDIHSLIEARRWSDLRVALEDWPPPELADLLLQTGKQERVLLFRALPRDAAAEAFAHLELPEQDDLLEDLTDQETRQLLRDLAPDDRTELLEELPAEVTRRLMNMLGPDDLAETKQLLGYPEESVGRLMTPDFVAVRPHWTIAQALRQVRRKGKDSETINRIYVVDDQWKLVDDIALRWLILADPDTKVEDVLDHNFASVSAFDDREEAVRIIQRYDQVALPVVDSAGVLVGIVTVDDVLDVAEEEATEDFHKAASVAPLKRGYWETAVFALYRMRIGWLAALVLINLASSSVIAAYEETLEAMIALAFFIPLIIDTGGNAGTQSATIMIRAISTGDVELSEWGRAFSREIGLGALLGLTLGILGAGLGLIRGGAEIGVIVFLTMVIMLTLTNLVGMILPFILARLNVDPAVASGPLITSIADTVGLLIYFSVAVGVMNVMGYEEPQEDALLDLPVVTAPVAIETASPGYILDGDVIRVLPRAA
jgi:magnesium transporter